MKTVLPRCTSRALGALAVAAAALIGSATAAGAHVSVTPAEAPKGSTVDLTFESPNEGRAAIVAVEVAMPEGITEFVPAAPAGWTVGVAGQVVRWSGGRVAPGATTAFHLRLGPLPSTESVRFPVVQTFEDGSVERWIEASTGGGHPAPAVTLTGAPVVTTTSTVGTGGHGHETVETAGDTRPVATETTEKTDSITGTIGVVLTITGVLSVLGWVVFVGLRARAQSRRMQQSDRAPG